MDVDLAKVIVGDRVALERSLFVSPEFPRHLSDAQEPSVDLPIDSKVSSITIRASFLGSVVQ